MTDPSKMENDMSANEKRSFLQRFRSSKKPEQTPAEVKPEPSMAAAAENTQKETLGDRFRRALSKTGRTFGNLFLGDREIDDALLEELETLLLQALRVALLIFSQ